MSLRKIGLLARYCNNFCFCLDIDENEAGQRATPKAIAMISQFGFCDKISLLEGLPQGKDPDEFVIENGKEKFLEMEKELSYTEIKEICRNVKLEKMNRKK